MNAVQRFGLCWGYDSYLICLQMNPNQSCTSDASILCFSPFTETSITQPNHHIIITRRLRLIRERLKPPRHSEEPSGLLITASISSDAREFVKKIRRSLCHIAVKLLRMNNRKAFIHITIRHKPSTEREALHHRCCTQTRSHNTL